MKKISIAIFALLVGLASPAFAYSDDALKVNTAGSVQINTAGSNREVEGGQAVGTDVELDRVGLQVKTGINSTSTVHTGDDKDSTNDETENSDDSGITVGESIRVEARELRGWDEQQKQAFMLSLKSAIEISTGKDLEHFAQGVLLKDESVSKVEIDNNGVAITYHQPAKLFGFVGSRIATTVSVSDDADVKVTFPWYRFLFRISDDEDRVALEQSIRAKLSAHVRAENEIQNRAQLLEIVSVAIKEKTKVNADVNAEVNANSTGSVTQ